MEHLIVPSIIITEVLKIVRRQSGEDKALQAIAHMEYGIDLKLPLADSIIYATGKKFSALIWTQDDDFKSLKGVKYYPKVKN